MTTITLTELTKRVNKITPAPLKTDNQLLKAAFEAGFYEALSEVLNAVRN